MGRLLLRLGAAASGVSIVSRGAALSSRVRSQRGLQGRNWQRLTRRYAPGVFGVGDRVQLAEHFRSNDLDPHGIVVESDRSDVIVRWDTGIEAALAPESLAAADRADHRDGRSSDNSGARRARAV